MIPPVELAKSRDFGEIINDTFIFIRQNWKQLLKNYFIFCGFFLLAGGLMQCLNQYKMIGAMNSAADGSYLNSRFSFLGIEYVFAALFMYLGYCTSTVTTLSYISLYKQKNNVAPAINEVWAYIKHYYLRTLWATFVTFLLLVIGFVLCILPGFYLYPILGLVFPVMIIENTSFGYAFSRSFQLIKENWWVTFGTMVVVIIIVYFLAAIVTIPASLINISSLLLRTQKNLYISPGTIIFASFLQQIAQVFTIIPIIAITLCYFNLSESKDGTSLLDRINKFGEGGPQTNLPAEEY